MILCQWGISLILSLLVITYKKTRKENPLLPPSTSSLLFPLFSFSYLLLNFKKLQSRIDIIETNMTL